jgi:DHA2 family multidrug resistance protein
VVLAFGCLQVVLDKGQEVDWFGSPLIIAFAALTVIGFVGLILWETLVEPEPVVDLSLLKNGPLATSMALQFAVGFVLNSTTVLIPLLAQELLGYNATQAGLVLMPGGLTLIFMMPLAGQLVRHFQPKYIMAFGLTLLTLSLFLMSGFNAQVAFGNLLWARVLQCLGLPLFFLPLNTIAYGNLPPGKSNQASAMMNLVRNLGGSIGIAMAATLLTRRTQVHQAYLAMTATRTRPALVQHFDAAGGFTRSNIASFYGSVQTQAAMLSYLDVFRILTIACIAVIAVVLMLRRSRKDAPVVLGH